MKFIYIPLILSMLSACGDMQAEVPVPTTGDVANCKEDEFRKALAQHGFNFEAFSLDDSKCSVTAFCGFNDDDICDLRTRPDSFYCPTYKISGPADYQWVQVCQPGQENNPNQP